LLRLAQAAALSHVDLGAVVAGDAVRIADEVDVRHRLDLAIEHDREVLRAALNRLSVSGARTGKRAALSLTPGDLVEDLLALVRELHQHDRPARLRIDVRAGAVELEILARHLGDRVVWELLLVVVLQQVEDLVGRDLLVAQAVAFLWVAADDHGFGRHLQDLPVLRNLLAEAALGRRLLDLLAVQQRLLRRRRPCHDPLRRVEEIPLRGDALGGEQLGLRGGEQLVQAPDCDRHPRQPPGHRRAGQVRLEVVELEHRRLADQVGGLALVVDAGELDDDLIGALLSDLRLGDAELVDPVAHDVDRPVDVRRGQLVTLRWDRFQDDLEATLQVEAQRRAPVDRRARDRQERNADERRDDDAEQSEVSTPVCHA